MKLPRADRQRARLENDLHSTSQRGVGNAMSRCGFRGEAQTSGPAAGGLFLPLCSPRQASCKQPSLLWEAALQGPDQDACAAVSSGSLAMTSG